MTVVEYEQWVLYHTDVRYGLPEGKAHKDWWDVPEKIRARIIQYSWDTLRGEQ